MKITGAVSLGILAVAGLVSACGGKTGIPEDRLRDDERVQGPCPDQHPCATEHCSLVVPSGALPVTAKVDLTERPQPNDLAGETTAPFVCEILTSGAPTSPLDLTVRPGGPIPPDTILFKYDDVVTAVKSSTPTGERVQALVPGTGVYGVTRSALSWSLESTYVNDPLASGDTRSLLRNLARLSTVAAYWDGAHFYVGNGPRVLIWNGIPTPDQRPAIVVGAPDLDHLPSGTSSSVIGGSVSAIWSNGRKLVVAAGNRVLVWNALPTKDFATADLVLGQQDFVSNGGNVGGVSASTLSAPTSVDSDGERLLVADTQNHRVLAWSRFPTTIGEPAVSVLGQGSFGANAIGTFYQPASAVLDGEGAQVASQFSGPSRFATLATNTLPSPPPVPAGGSSRVYSDGLPFASGVALLPRATAYFDGYGRRVAVHRNDGDPGIHYALGQPDPTRFVAGLPTASTFGADARMTYANGKLLIADRGRVLVYDSPPTFNFEPASRVVAAPGFSVSDTAADYRGISERTLAAPADIVSNGRVSAVADRGNNRVLLFGSDFPVTNATAFAVLGQRDFGSFAVGADTMSGPAAVAIDERRLFVADTENHRVLVWSPIPTSSNVPPNVVLGQIDFSSRRPNHGNGDADTDGFSDADSVGMFAPSGIATNGQQLFVSDRLNHRVLVWNDVSSLTNGRPADRVLGQSTFTSVKANHGKGAYAPQLDGFNVPEGITLVGSSLWVADGENNRVVRWDNVLTDPVAAAVLGQPNGTTVSNPNVFGLDSANVGAARSLTPAAGELIHPRSVAVQGNQIFVSETSSHRVQIFRQTGARFDAVGQLGQRVATTAVPNENGIGPHSLSSPIGISIRESTLFVADAGNHRVLAYDMTAESGASAAKVLGQPSFLTSGFNQSAASTAGGATRPRAIALAGGDLYVAETSRHRVVVHSLPLVSGQTPKLVLGQTDANLALPNGGGSANAGSMSSPNGVYVDDAHVIVADTGNNRVLLYPRGASEATVVLGQATFDATTRNGGGSATLSTLAAPSAATVVGSRLFVSDTGNHRVLVWESFPTQNGQPADYVIGQASAAGGLANRGFAAASARSLNLPGALFADETRLFVADTGNNRVVAYKLPVGTDAEAVFALGQPDLVDRTASSDINDTSRLAGPVALASDGTNLFVADRDSNRVVAYDLATAAMGVKARTLFNSNSGLVAVGPAGLAVERTPLFTSRLFVADTNNDRILVLSPVSRLR